MYRPSAFIVVMVYLLLGAGIIGVMLCFNRAFADPEQLPTALLALSFLWVGTWLLAKIRVGHHVLSRIIPLRERQPRIVIAIDDPFVDLTKASHDRMRNDPRMVAMRTDLARPDKPDPDHPAD